MSKVKMRSGHIQISLGSCALLALVVLCARQVAAFPVLAAPGDTLAVLAQRVYAGAEHERLLAATNGLEQWGAGPLPPGTRIEVPTVSYRRVARGETWAELGRAALGAPERGAALAFANGSKPWLPPAEGAEILVPYNLQVIAQPGDTLSSLARRFFGSERRAWMLAEYNGQKDVGLTPGQLVLLPISDLALTEAGREAARAALESWSGLGGERREQQAAAAEALPTLLANVRAGRSVESVALGVALIAGSALTLPQRAAVQRQLLEAYTALGADGRAADACREWRLAAPQARLDARELSPKLLAACSAAR